MKQGKGQPIREDGPQRHIVAKQGTPTMGGLMILSGIFVSTLLWAELGNLYVWVVLFVTLGYGAIGFYDDFLKVTQPNDQGLLRQDAPAGGDRRRGHRGCMLHVDRRPAAVDLARRARSSRTC